MNHKKPTIITERGMNMKRTHLIAALGGLIAVGLFATNASAMYNPSTGTFMQRDPGAGSAMRAGAGWPEVGGGFIPRDSTGQYADGMNLYQYVRSQPTVYVDPSGLHLLRGGPFNNPIPHRHENWTVVVNLQYYGNNPEDWGGPGHYIAPPTEVGSYTSLNLGYSGGPSFYVSITGAKVKGCCQIFLTVSGGAATPGPNVGVAHGAITGANDVSDLAGPAGNFGANLIYGLEVFTNFEYVGVGGTIGTPGVGLYAEYSVPIGKRYPCPDGPPPDVSQTEAYFRREVEQALKNVTLAMSSEGVAKYLQSRIGAYATKR